MEYISLFIFVMVMALGFCAVMDVSKEKSISIAMLAGFITLYLLTGAHQ